MEVAAQACERFEADAETEALCAACRWPVHFHTPSSPSSAQEAPSPRKASPRLSQTPMRSSGVWGARPSEGLQKRGSAVLSSTRVSLPPSKPLPVPAAVASPKEVAATLRRVVKLELVEQDGAEYSCASGADMVLALMHHRKVSRSDAIETGRLLLSSGYLASVGTRGGFADAQDRYFSFVVLPELASVGRSLEHGTVAWDQQPSAELRPFEDVRTLVATVLGCAWRFDYRTTSPYAAYFVHVAEGEQSGITVTRRFADCSELHRLLSKKYAARLLPALPKEKRGSNDVEKENRASLQAFLVALVDCRFLAHEPEFIRFFRDMGADSTPLMVNRSLVPLEEAFLLLSSSFRDVSIREQAVARLRVEDRQSLVMYSMFLVAALRHEPQPRSALLNFLLEAASADDELATLMFWHLQVEKANNGGPPMANFELACVLLEQSVRPELKGELAAQQHVVTKLAETVSAVANSRRDRPAKIERLREILGGSFGVSLRGMSPPLLFPLCPELRTSGIDHNTATLYKSNLLPLGLDWRVTRSGAPRPDRAVDANLSLRDGVLIKRTIFKKGDDLRQDQLVTSFVSLIASLLSLSSLDLSMCVYRVLATSVSEGLIEVVPEAHNVSSVLEEHGSISMFLMKNNRHQASHSDAVENYIRSCAGYSIVTYFLGVGDRHLDNILITNDGKLFHVDFGFILGNDPKPMPPAVRLTQEMIEGMGGLDSKGYNSYLGYCASAYNILRRYSPLLINLFAVVCESGLPGIESTRDAVSFLYSRLNLHMDDDRAAESIKATINQSAQLLFPQLMERLHQVAQKNRK